MHSLYTVADIRKIEQAAKLRSAQESLMQHAGRSAAELSLQMISKPFNDAHVLVMAGPGDNGGDALVAAAQLAENGVRVTVLLYADPHTQSADAAQGLRQAQASKAEFAKTDIISATLAMVASTQWALIIDGLFGTGLKRAITGDLQSLVLAINTLRCPVLALDVPSGLDADTGNIIGADGIAVRASRTLTYIADKPGLHTCSGRDVAGEVQIERLDIASALYPQPHLFLNTPELFSHLLKPRRHNTHKGSYGDVAVVGGAQGMAGAAILSARAALHCGAGRVYAVCLDGTLAFDPQQPELMCRAVHEFAFGTHILVVGPGLGQSRPAADVLAKALHTHLPLVLDADALNLLALESNLQPIAAHRNAATIITPHPLEAARLLAISSAEVQQDRMAAARALAERFNAVVILKGSGTVIASPDNTIVINPTGNPGLATAGTGDVLSGICAALLAQDIPPWEAALAATWVHGRAADMLAEQQGGPIGMTASELIPAVRQILNNEIARQI